MVKRFKKAYKKRFKKSYKKRSFKRKRFNKRRYPKRKLRMIKSFKNKLAMCSEGKTYQSQPLATTSFTFNEIFEKPIQFRPFNGVFALTEGTGAEAGVIGNQVRAQHF